MLTHRVANIIRPMGRAQRLAFEGRWYLRTVVIARQMYVAIPRALERELGALRGEPVTVERGMERSLVIRFRRSKFDDRIR